LTKIKQKLSEALPLSLKFQLKSFAAALSRLARRDTTLNLKRLTEAHSKSELRILVVDDVIPAPDRDAGSARMFSILQTLVKLGSVTFISLAQAERPEYESLLRREGVEIQPWQNYKYLLKQRRFQLAVFSRPNVAGAILPTLKRILPHCKTIFDTVDIGFVRLQREFELIGDESISASARKSKKLETRLALMADQVWCVTTDDAAALAREAPGSQFEIIPTIHPLADSGKSFDERAGLLFVGNFLHRPNRDAVHYFMGEIFPLIRAELGDVDFSIVGDNSAADILQYQSNHVSVMGHVADIEPLFASCRVFIAPLRFGAGMKGKIGQALSHGVPVVTTPIGAEGMGLTNGHNILIAETASEFAEALVEVYRQLEVWQRLADNGYRHTQENFTPEVVEKKIRHAIGKLINTSD